MVVVLDEQCHYNVEFLLNVKSLAEKGICVYDNQVAFQASQRSLFL